MKKSNLNKLIKEELKVDQTRNVYLRGIKYFMNKFSNEGVNEFVDEFLINKNVGTLNDLSNEDLMDLNVQIQDLISSSKPTSSDNSPSNINPYDIFPGKKTFKGTYTGD